MVSIIFLILSCRAQNVCPMLNGCNCICIFVFVFVFLYLQSCMKCLPNVDRVGQICVTAVDGMNVPQLADQKPNFAILVIFICVILWLFH